MGRVDSKYGIFVGGWICRNPVDGKGMMKLCGNWGRDFF